MIFIYTRRLIFGIFAIMMITSSALGQGISDFRFTPSEALINRSTTIFITAKINDAANSLKKDSVLLYETTASGQILALVGRMYDDGTNGDLKAQDGVYTTQITVNENSPITRFYKVSAAYSGLRNRVLSDQVTMQVLPPLPDSVILASAQLIRDVQSHFDLNVSTIGLQQARQAAIAELHTNPNVGPMNAELINNTISLFYIYIDPSTGYTFHLPGLILVEDPSVPSAGAGVASPTNVPVDAQFPGNDNVLIYAPWYSTPTPRQMNVAANYAKQKFDNGYFMSFNPKPIIIAADSSASLEVIKQWSNYAVIIYTGHGGYWNVPYHSDLPKQVILSTGTPDTVISDELRLDISTGRVGRALGRYVIFPAYISRYVGNMTNTFIYLGACDSLKDYSMWNALAGRGATVGFGFSETVSISFVDSTFKALIDQMLPVTGLSNPPNAKQAFDSIPHTDSYIFPPATSPAVFKFVTASPSWEKYEFVQKPIILNVTGSVAGYPLPAQIQLSGFYSVDLATFQRNGTAGNTCGNGVVAPGERGAPLFSNSVDISASLFGAPGVIGVPSRLNSPAINRKPCSSFYANKRDLNNNGSVWINATGRAVQFGGPFPIDWEYQVRYYSGSPAANYSDKSCKIGIVANANYFAGSDVTCNVACDVGLLGKLASNQPVCQ